MLELFNEPQNDTSRGGWSQWQNGGTTPLVNLGDAAVGHQTLIADVRAAGANNVLLADGALHSEHLDAVPLLHDIGSGKGVAYAVHPYYFSPGQSYWDKSFGYLAPSVPIVATEWNYLAAKCGTTSETLAPLFLQYLHGKNIGVTAHAFDIPNTTITTLGTWAPTQCGTAVGGSGQDFKSYLISLP